jgi:hypothetical protein
MADDAVNGGLTFFAACFDWAAGGQLFVFPRWTYLT